MTPNENLGLQKQETTINSLVKRIEQLEKRSNENTAAGLSIEQRLNIDLIRAQQESGLSQKVPQADN